mmetsp:Transcript_3032/g.7681  ORF Transcript_3032/g.7681 Transcript_3032/m.7681 type:complete len:696 (+) Transcript_3032:136-2223(+)|eukprot:CAMPEP_0181096526 /NCGR_PEP_ID=MMETSP1071-20121207/11082_1 /TAXON_ID=35127 /ORGANISM="Thalassiosira sp., Strain NH16" /LENGTH=695 /DNA_ID=CAMNT_0023178945 /DNA_START=38 /DNA_END=2125 /DNA_ORIENTATION=+
MRARNENDDISMHAIVGTHCVLLGFDVKGYESNGPSTDLSVLMSEMALRSDDNRYDMTKKAASSNIKSKNTSTVVFSGFAVERLDPLKKQNVSLNFDGRPIQKFHFGDYTAVPGMQYEYTVRRMTKAQSSVASTSKFVAYGSSVTVKITTEDPTEGVHGIYFNRGVAGSKAYSDKFHQFSKYHRVNKFGIPRWKSIINPRSIPDPDKSQEALTWLSRGLEEALLQFISQASGSDYRLLATVYEFTHEETIRAFASAVERGVDVKIIRHCKGTHRARVKRNDIVKDENGKVVKDWEPDGPTAAAKKAIDEVGFTSLKDAHTWHHETFIERHYSAGIMHNKFIVLVRKGKPLQVWTGSTNPTDSGIYGQSNVGHIVRSDQVASQYVEYWKHLSRDLPGRKHPSKTNDGGGSENEDNDPMDDFNERQQPDIEGQVKSPSIKVIFSPRKTIDMLQWYADRMGDAKSSVHYTAAFGIAQPIAQILKGENPSKPEADEGLRRSPRIARRCKKNEATSDSLLRYVLMDNKPSEHSSEKSRASAEKKGKEWVDYYDFKENKSNRIAYGAILTDDDDGAHDHGESLTGLTTFVDYIHTKYMIVDALTDNPLVITGSANFSAASTDKNDENSLVIQGDTRVADVYLTEFMRLFDHFYSRDRFLELGKRSSGKSGRVWDEVVMDESWLQPYFDPSTQVYRERLFFR